MAEVVEFPGTPSAEAETGTVAVPERAELADAEVVEGVVVDEAAPVPASAPLRVVQVVRVVVQHEHTRTAGRHLAYVPIGASVVVRRLWDSRTTARYERFMRAAEATGNHEAALEWDDRMQRFRKDRHQRRVDMIEVPVRLLLAVPKIALGLFLVLAVLGIFLGIAAKCIAEIAAPFEVVARIVEWVAFAVSVSYGPVLLALPWIGLGGRGGEVRLRLYLLLTMMATQFPFDIRNPPTPMTLARTLALPPSSGPRRINDNLKWLEDHHFIERTKRPGQTAAIQLLDPQGNGAPLPNPRGTARPWVMMPIEFWSHGWLLVLSPTGIAVLFALIERLGGRKVSMYLTRDRRESYNLSHDTWTRGRQELEQQGLLTVSRVPQGDDYDYRRLRNSYWIDKQRLLMPPL